MTESDACDLFRRDDEEEWRSDGIPVLFFRSAHPRISSSLPDAFLLLFSDPLADCDSPLRGNGEGTSHLKFVLSIYCRSVCRHDTAVLCMPNSQFKREQETSLAPDLHFICSCTNQHFNYGPAWKLTLVFSVKVSYWYLRLRSLNTFTNNCIYSICWTILQWTSN